MLHAGDGVHSAVRADWLSHNPESDAISVEGVGAFELSDDVVYVEVVDENRARNHAILVDVA